MAMDRYCVVDPSWELIDPNPDIYLLFSNFNEMFFWGQLSSVYVQWSPRMTLCAGMCRYHPRNRECSIHLSKPLLSYRPRKDLVETLLHEMIHAFLFIADGDRERESHGPKFHEHMFRINRLTGANITVYHSFNDEVDHFRTHWWKCNGPCQNRPPYYGIVKRSMNRPPGPSDHWYKAHQQSCGGQYTKIREPSPKKQAKKKKDEQKSTGDENKQKNKITNYFNTGSSASSPPARQFPPPSATVTSETANISSLPNPVSTQIVDPFAGRGFVLGAIENNPNAASATSISNSHKTFVEGAGSSTSGNSSSSGFKLGGGSSQPLRRGEHPLLAKLFANQNKSSTNASSKTASSFAEPRQPSLLPSGNHGVRRENQSTQSSSGSKGGVKRKLSIEVIDLD